MCSLLSQPLLEERFDAPLDSSWSFPAASPTVRLAITPASAHWGAAGIQLDKLDAGPRGQVTYGALSRGLGGALAPEVHFRAWFNLAAGPTSLRVSPLQVGQPRDAFTLGELYTDPGGSGALLLSCADTNFRSRRLPTPVVAGRWSLLELDLEGLGTADGGCRGAIDGVEISMSGFAWSNRGAAAIVGGFNVVSDGWVGSYFVDDLTLTRERLAIRTALGGPDPLDAGACGPLQLSFSGRDGGALPPPSTARFLASVDGGALFTDDRCRVALASAQELTAAQAGALHLTLAAPLATVTLRSNDLLPTTLEVRLNPLVAVPDAGPDAGSPDAGSPDAGSVAPLEATVGCGCNAPGWPGAVALLALLWRRGAGARLRPRVA